MSYIDSEVSGGNFMCKKGTKIHNRLRKVSQEKVNKLYEKCPFECSTCVYCKDCAKVESMDDTMSCDLYDRMHDLNDLIEMIREQNVNLDAFCEKNGLKKEFLLDMLRAKMMWDFKYYNYLIKRLHIIEDEDFEKCKVRFENNDSVGECEDI